MKLLKGELSKPQDTEQAISQEEGVEEVNSNL
jgi:hypothetical protein